jgi:hypothetical protein
MIHAPSLHRYTMMHGQSLHRYTMMHGQSLHRYNMMHGQSLHRYNMMHGQQHIKKHCLIFLELSLNSLSLGNHMTHGKSAPKKFLHSHSSNHSSNELRWRSMKKTLHILLWEILPDFFFNVSVSHKHQ